MNKCKYLSPWKEQNNPTGDLFFFCYWYREYLYAKNFRPPIQIHKIYINKTNETVYSFSIYTVLDSSKAYTIYKNYIISKKYINTLEETKNECDKILNMDNFILLEEDKYQKLRVLV